MDKKSVTLLNAVSDTTTGTAQTVQDVTRFTFYLEPSGTVEMVHKIQALADSGTWFDVDSRSLASTAAVLLQCSGPFKQVRAKVTITTGTITTSMHTQ